jgi:Ulp1 family protease
MVYLNDEAINFMLNIFGRIIPPEEEENKDKYVVMNTFLYPQLVKVEQYNDDKIKRFLKRKIKPNTQYLLIPINLESHSHWSLAIIANLNHKVAKDSS